MHSILVKDYMDHNPHAIPVTTNIRDVVKSLLQAGVIGAPVIDENEKVVGFVSEQDCISEMLNNAFYCEEPAPVTAVMHTDVLTVTPETSIVEVAQTMTQNKPKNFPVVDNGKLVGLINRSLILKSLIEYDEDCYIHR
ncbi:MAG: CBS domain-containing protein [Exilibacterium sp.]